LIKFILINFYKENKIKRVISKQEEVKEKENEPEINKELDIDFNEVQEKNNAQMSQAK